MGKYVNYKIISDLELVAEYFYGEVLAEDIIDLKRKELADSAYNPNFNTIVFLQDLTVRKLDAELIESQMSKYIQYASTNDRVLGNRKTAILTNTPNQVAIGTLYQDDAKEFPIKFKIVSTLEATMEWVGLPLGKSDEVSDILKYFRSERN